MMTRNKKLRAILIVFAFALMGFPGMASAGDEGCVTCHAGELSLNLVMKKFEVHPPVEMMVNTVPTDCLMCHGEGSDLALSTIVHKAHFAADAEMSCTTCHTMNAETGEATLKSGAKNW